MKILGKSSLSSKLKLLLDVIWYAGLVIAVITVCVLPHFIFVGAFNYGEVKMTVGAINFEMESGVNQLISADGTTAYISDGAGTITVNGAIDRSTSAVAFVAVLVVVFLCLYIIWQLRRLFRTFVEDKPFDLTNVRRLRAIAVSILSLVVVSFVYQSIMAIIIRQQFKAEGIHLVAIGDLDLPTLFAALVIFILAEIFRLGAELEEEKNLTV